jgi:hypothetical protein
MKHLFILILLIGFLKITPARADFGLTASVVGLGVGVGLVAAAPFLDKRDQDEEIEEGKPTCSECESGNEDEKAGVDEEEFFNLDLSKTALEDLKLKAREYHGKNKRSWCDAGAIKGFGQEGINE